MVCSYAPCVVAGQEVEAVQCSALLPLGCLCWGVFAYCGGGGGEQGFFRIIKTQGGGDPSPKTPSPPPQTKVTIVGKNEIYNRENLVRPFLVHQVLGPKPPAPLPPPAQKKPWRGGEGGGAGLYAPATVHGLVKVASTATCRHGPSQS